MASKRKIEIFSADCALCEATVARVDTIAGPSCEVSVLDIRDAAVAQRAERLGVGSVPAVAIDGKLADCCSGRGPDEAVLRAVSVGQPLT